MQGRSDDEDGERDLDEESTVSGEAEVQSDPNPLAEVLTPSSSVDEAECRSKKTRQPPRMLTYDNMGLLSYTLIGQVDVAVDCINFN